MPENNTASGKIVAMRADVMSIRESLEAANQFKNIGVAFVCVPYFTPDQKAIAVGLAENFISQLKEPET